LQNPDRSIGGKARGKACRQGFLANSIAMSLTQTFSGFWAFLNFIKFSVKLSKGYRHIVFSPNLT
jgi:hypothetical protein